MDLRDSNAVRRAVLQTTLDEIDGRGDGSHWFEWKFLEHFKHEQTQENRRPLHREIKYLVQKDYLEVIPSDDRDPDMFAVTGITWRGRDALRESKW